LRLKHFERLTFVMWPAWGDVELNAINGFIKTLPLAFTFMDYQKLWGIPKSTNVLEGYISNLNARLKGSVAECLKNIKFSSTQKVFKMI